MAKYSVTLSDAEIRAMEHVCTDVNEWVQNAFNHRILTAMTGLSELEMAKALKFKKEIVTNREKLIELSNEPPMSAWLAPEEYNPNPDNPFINPQYKLPETDPSVVVPETVSDVNNTPLE